METHRDEYRAAGGSLWQGVESDCQFIKDRTDTDLDEEVLQNLICSVRTESEMSLISI